MTIDDHAVEDGRASATTTRRSASPAASASPASARIDFGDGGHRHHRHRRPSATSTDNKTFQISEKLSLSKGRHYLSVGGQVHPLRHGPELREQQRPPGRLRFNGAFTGFGFADFLLDQVGAEGASGGSGPLGRSSRTASASSSRTTSRPTRT